MHVQSTFLSKKCKILTRLINFSLKKSAKYKHVQPTFLSARSKVCKQSVLCEAGCTKKKFSERKSEMERKVQNVNMSNQIFSQSKKSAKYKAGCTTGKFSESFQRPKLSHHTMLVDHKRTKRSL